MQEIEVIKYTDDPKPTVLGRFKTTDSRGRAADLVFEVNTATDSVRLALDGQPKTYISWNDRLIPATASEDSLGYVFVRPTYEHNIMTEEQASGHYWSEEGYQDMRDGLMSAVVVRVDKARQAADYVYRHAMTSGAA